MEAWGATNEKELQDAILTYWKDNMPKGWDKMHKDAQKPLSFAFGGTTKELIKNKKKWDVGIVSSKDVDLQKLADASVLKGVDWAPSDEYPLHQWLLPEKAQSKLPQHPLYYYAVYCYAYNPQTDEAIFIICNDKSRLNPWKTSWARQIIEKRDTEEIRALEGLRRTVDWRAYEKEELSPTPAQLVAHPQDWDWAFLRMDKENVSEALEELDAAGVLYDFSTDAYWSGRNPDWDEPKGLFSADGRMIAIPYNAIFYKTEENEMTFFVINGKSPVLSRALEFAEHYIKGYEWLSFGRLTHYSDPKRMKEVGLTRFQIGDFSILKEDVNW
ncbi:MAG: hypothetical protein MRZ54_05695 [Clostridiales bacterium]|nr:hypothetical protein [Clostridiales bacterium]